MSGKRAADRLRSCDCAAMSRLRFFAVMGMQFMGHMACWATELSGLRVGTRSWASRSAPGHAVVTLTLRHGLGTLGLPCSLDFCLLNSANDCC